MKLSVEEAARDETLQRVIVRSLDHCVYTASALVAGGECILTDERGRTLRARNLLAMRESLASLAHCPAVLRQDSAYDEMVGQAPDGPANTLEIPLSLAAVDGDMLS
jgi:hypothetical protein